MGARNRPVVTSADLERASAHVPRLLLGWPAEHGDARHAVIDGTTVFADISGFTKLSERLARLGGKSGAEQVAGVVSTAFHDLLTVVAAHGGEMLKFGGDAVLLLFRGPHHPVRAAAACIAMQAAIESFDLPELPGRPMKLRVSIGAHTGHIDVFHVGDRHHDLVVAGPDTTTTMELEGSANAGETLVSAALAAAIGVEHVASARRGGHPLRSAPVAPLSGSRARGDLTRALDCIPLGYRHHLIDGLIEPSHRLAAVSFVHVGGIDATLAKHGGARAAEDLHQTYVTISDVFERYGVCLLASDVYANGTKMIGVAGAPETVEEPERCMLRSLREVLDANVPLPVRAGVHRGHIFAGEVGPSFRRTYTVIGDVVNTAARIAAHARPGELLALGATLDLAGSGIDLDELPPFMAKGKKEPLVPYRVRRVHEHRPDQATANTTTQLLTFVGRDRELDVLRAALDAAREGRGGALHVLGEAGMGKTRLVEEALATSGDLRTIRLRCEPYERHTPWFPIRHLIAGATGQQGRSRSDAVEVIRTILAGERPSLLAWLPLCAAVLDAPIEDTPETAALDDRFRRGRTIAAVLELLEVLLPVPTVLFFDDLHAADEPSLELIAELALGAAARPWLVLTASRETSSSLTDTTGGAEALQLLPLEDAAVDELLQHTSIEPPLTPIDRRVLIARAAGTPLFISALLRARELGESSIPDSVEAVVALEIDRFGHDERELLRAAAVLGSSFDPAVLDAVLVGTDLDHRLAQRSALQGVLDAEGPERLRFRHQLLRDVVYETTPYRQRKELHQRAAAAIEADLNDEIDDRVGVLAIHLECAGQHDGVWRYARMAADRAARRDAYDIAADLLERATAAGTRLGLRGPELARAYEQLGEAAAFNDASGRADVAYRRARRHAKEDRILYARLCRKQARLAELSASWTTLRRWITRGLQAIEGLSGPEAAAERAGLLVVQAWIHRKEGRANRAEATARLALAEARLGESPSTEAAAHLEVDRALVQLGRHDEAVHSATALELLAAEGQRAELAVALNAIGLQAQRLGRWDEALELFEQARQEMRATGNLADQGVVEFNIAEILCDQGRADDADQVLDELTRLWRSVRHPIGAHWVEGLRGRVLLRRGLVSDARPLLDAACEALHQRGMAPHAALFEPARIECALLQGRTSDAQALLDGVAPGGLIAEATIRRLRGCVHLAGGAHDLSLSCAQSAVALAREARDPFELARCLQLADHLNLMSGQIDGHHAERQEIIAALGVVDLPPVPVASSADQRVKN